MVESYWQIGRRIFKEEQQGQQRAGELGPVAGEPGLFCRNGRRSGLAMHGYAGWIYRQSPSARIASSTAGLAATCVM